MTSLEPKQQVQPVLRKKRRWPIVVIACIVLCAAIIAVIKLVNPPETQEASRTKKETTTTTKSADEGDKAEEADTVSCTVNGVTYTFRPTTRDEHPTAIRLDNYFTLVRVEGVPDDGVFRVPSFVGSDVNSLVTAVADGAFDGTDAREIDLGHNVSYVWGNAFGGYALTDLYLHEDTFIEHTAFSGCSDSLTIHCAEYIENKDGVLWSELAAEYGYQWQSALI